MKRIQIISASAGSGKTYRLAELLEQEVAQGRVRPDAIVATTFTNQAAAELQERVRTFLLRAGRTDEAQRLGASRIGTVNSVCHGLVTDFAFELGLSPELAILDEEASEVELRQALSRALVLGDEAAELEDLAYRFGELEWQKAVEEIVKAARNNRIEDLAESAARSREEVLGLLDEARKFVSDKSLVRGIEKFLASFDTSDTTKKTQGAVDEAERALRRLKSNLPLPWATWLKLAKANVAVRSGNIAAPMKEAAAGVLGHPRLHADVVRAIELIYDLASRALETYAAHKRERGTIDFVDQEVLALELLRRPDVQKRLRSEIDLVLVDEFQDTSPIQLAVFLKLAELAKQSVWVGDQKQSIYGFRGADPALMDAAIAQILGGQEPETLPFSWRSRKTLVEATSEIFALAFERHGYPQARVRLGPKRVEAKGLPPEVVELWSLEATNQDVDCAAVAAGLAELLHRKDVRIEDPRTKQARALRAGDVAVLCRTNDACADVARELGALGVRSVLPRAGLVRTVHGRLARAGLRLWVDPEDSLAVAEVARIVDFADKPDAWLAAAVEKPAGEAFAKSEWLERIRSARDASRNAGAVAALDAVVDKLELPELCRSWLDGAARLADLDALRAHAVNYQDACEAEGSASTPAGLCAYLDELADAGRDERAVVSHGDAVNVLTWHRAKGLEWPVVVLFELAKVHSPTPLARVGTASERAELDLRDPLADRWIRFWPNPFGRQGTSAFHDRVDEHPATADLQRLEDRQALRLLYVGWTRARDRLVLAARGAVTQAPSLRQLTAQNGTSLLAEASAQGEAVWAGHKLRVVSRTIAPSAPLESSTEPTIGFDVAKVRPAHPAAALNPSELAEKGEATAQETIGDRLAITGQPDMACVGEAVHGFLAADVPGLAPDDRKAMAGGLLERWGVAEALRPEQLVQASDALRGWAARRFPDWAWRREWPVAQRLASGTMLMGRADLVLESDDSVVVVDHKSFPGSAERAVEKAAGFGGQLGAYAVAVAEATKKRVAGTFVHLPVSGMVVEVR